MTTKNLVPRASGEGSLGTSSLKWGTINALTGSFDATQFEALKNGADNDLLAAGSNITITYASGVNGNQYTIAASSTPITGVLEDLETLGTSAADGEFIVATGAGAFAYESGATVRTSLGLGTGDSPTFTSLTLSGQASSLSMNSQKITGLGTPTTDTDAATKAYVDGVAQGLDIYDTVVAATTASFTMASTASTTTLVLADGEGGFSASADTLTIDGVSLSQGDRVLIKDGVNSNNAGVSNKWNGIYTVGDLTASSLTLTRSTDMDVPSEFNTGAFFFVEQGTTNADSGFVLTTDGTVTVGTSDIEFTQFSGAGDITAGDGLSKTGNTLFVDSTVITAQTSISDPNVLDNFLLSDADDNGNLKRATLSDIVTGIFDTQSGSSTIADNDLVLIYDTSELGNRVITKANFVSGLAGISNVVEDTTPQLGGDLDLNTRAIVQTGANNMTLHVSGSDQDIFFKGNDGGSIITALTLDMSDAGTAIFNHDIKLGNGGVLVQHVGTGSKGINISLTTSAGDYEPMLRLTAEDGAAIGSFIVHKHAGAQALGTGISDTDVIGGTVYRTVSDIDQARFQAVYRANTHSDFEIGVRSGGGSIITALKIEGQSSGNPKVNIVGGFSLNSTAVTATATELNIIDGDTAAVSTTLVDADRVVVNDNGTMKQVAMTDVKNYINAISNVVEDPTPQLGGNLDVNGNDIVTTSNADLDLAPDGTGIVVLKGNTTGGNNPGAIKLNCEQNSHGITIKSPLYSSAATYTLTLPDTDGNANEVLQTDGSGNLSWVAQSSGGGGTSYTYSAVTAATVTAAAWYHYSVDTSSNAVTINLPALSGLTDGDEIRVKVRDNTNTVTIDANSTETIDGNQTLVLNTLYSSITLVAGSTEWEII
jgi:hypothetical protein